MKGYKIKVHYRKIDDIHRFTFDVGDKWNDKEILENIQWDRPMEGNINNQMLDSPKYWQAFHDVRIFITRMIWIQQYLNAIEGICDNVLKVDDYKDVEQDYVDYDHFVNQAVREVSEEVDLLIHETDFLDEKCD